MSSSQPPAGIDYFAADRLLRITWTEDHVGAYPVRDLRIACPCAGCVDEHTGVRTLDPATIPGDIDIADMSLVGNYAIKIRWSDGHDTGIHTWAHLRQLCPCPRCAG